MKRLNQIITIPLLMLFFAGGCAKKRIQFSDLPKIDAHFHIRYNGPEFLDQAVKDNFKIIGILTDHYDLVEQENFILKQWEHHPNDLLYLTAFSMQGWDKPDWQEKTIEWLHSAFEKGAAGVKVWKDIGMEYKDRDGNFIMIDNPRFDPVFDYIESQNKTLTAHIGEPKDCWLPLDKMVAESDREYYSHHPEYHMYLPPGIPFL